MLSVMKGIAVTHLADVLVLDLSTGISGPYATKLFADAGAEVVKVELPEVGDPIRHVGADGTTLSEDGALYRFLNAGKRLRTADLDSAEVATLVATADIVVESFEPIDSKLTELLATRPDLVVLSITPYGRRGPWVGRPTTQFIIEAESGALAMKGREDQVPYQSGARDTEWSSAVYGAVGALAALRRRDRTGLGEFVDCSHQAAATFGFTAFTETLHNLLGRPEHTNPARLIEVPSVEPTADGWVGFCTNTQQQFESLLAMAGLLEMLEQNPDWSRPDYRTAHQAEWNERLHGWTREHTTAEIVELATLFRIPVAPVNDAPGVLEHPHFAARDFFERSADGTFVQPSPPFKFDGVRARSAKGASTASPQPSPAVPAAVEPPDTRPLAGLRVLDVTAFFAGPSCGQVLAILGADVTHVESIQRPDGARTYVGPLYGCDQWWELGKMWISTNHNKADLTLNLASARGRELFLELVAKSDVVLENFSPRVFENFGLDGAMLRERNPGLIFVRMPAFGLDGPWRDMVGFAQTMEQMSGKAWVTGHLADQPRIPRGPCDPVAGYHAAFALLMALRERDRSGAGAHVEVAMIETAVNTSADQLVEFSERGTTSARMGNRSLTAAPQGLYAGRGWEQWLAISIETEAHWSALREVLGDPPWMAKPDFSTAAERRHNHDVLDDELAAWARDLDVDELVDQLVARGVPAGRACDPREMSSHPQLSEWGYFERIDHLVAGELEVPTIPFRYRSFERWITSPSPLLGQHNAALLKGRLGLDDAQFEQLRADQVIGTVPARL